jgi:ATP cone domain-containing protein
MQIKHFEKSRRRPSLSTIPCANVGVAPQDVVFVEEEAMSSPLPLPRLASIPVFKRDGKRVAFDLAKIESAIARAGAASDEFGSIEAARLAKLLARTLARRDGATLSVETIQAAVEVALLRARHLRGCAPTGRPSSTSRHPSTNTSSSRTGASTPTRTRAIRSAG